MPISSMPSGGPGVPAGATKVSVKELLVGGTSQKEDVTTIGDSARVYADPPLKDGTDASPTMSCTASGFLEGSAPTLTPMTTTSGWICEETEVTYEVGKYATWSATWNYYEPPAP